MKILPGSRALSEFRLQRLAARLREVCPGIDAISASFVYLLDLDRSLSSDDETRLRGILIESGEAPVEVGPGELFLIAPRPGTISPWSSKATDILHNCGLEEIRRVERARALVLRTVSGVALGDHERAAVAAALHDRMTETVFAAVEDAEALFVTHEPSPLGSVDTSQDAQAAIERANGALGLALSADEIEYLAANYATLARNPTDVELMMFAQANSEHCRHKIFNADWIIDGQARSHSLFGMIRESYQASPDQVLSAYCDNAAVITGSAARLFHADPVTHEYVHCDEPAHILMKVETHNHPTAISPFPGAATGSGGEIRDEGATGIGGRPKAGLCGFSVSNLRIPGFEQPWETDYGKPDRIVSALEIMLEGPIGAASFNNEFGRPCLTGYFRTYEESVPGVAGPEIRGYHKPIMVAGGLGSVRAGHVTKRALPVGTPIVVLGGPAMLIGLGGGAASSMSSGTSAADLDFASVQRGNPEMQRRCQEVINHCIALGERNPILSVHDVGAGGLSNAVPEIVNDARRGGRFELRAVPSAEPGMSPMEIWCNEAQERYVVAINAGDLTLFEQFCQRERCPYAVIGETTEERHLLVGDGYFDNYPVDLPMEMLLGKPPKMLRDVKHHRFHKPELTLRGIDLEEAAERVLRMPTVAAKTFLITIGDRTVTGLVARDQMVGPWQVPVADVAVTLSDYHGYSGEAMAMGERAPIALLNAPASGRMAVGEAITNIAAAAIARLSDIKLSANWMAPAGHPGEDAALFETVKAVGAELCPALGIAIPVGKDSMAMKSVWHEKGEPRQITAPISLIVSAFAPVVDARKTLTPRLRIDVGDTDLILIDLGRGRNRLGGSCLAQAYKQIGHLTPDLNEPQTLKLFFETIQDLNRDGLLLAYHDRSDGGLFVTLCEMAFAGHCGLEVDLVDGDLLALLFNEELGAVIQVAHQDTEEVLSALREAGLDHATQAVGTLRDDDQIMIRHGRQIVFTRARAELQAIWQETSYRMQALRGNPECARQEFESVTGDDPGLFAAPSFDLEDDIAAPYVHKGLRPRVAILREQGVNGHREMAAAFDRAGFKAVDVHMTDVIAGREAFTDMAGLIACGGFSYGDVLGAGGGWAKSVLHNPRARDAFQSFFQRDDVFGLGVCNGCQMFSQLRELIPGAGHWPYFRRNVSEQFEARLTLVEVLPSPSILLAGMQGSCLPIAVAHGEGRVVFEDNAPESVMKAGLVALCYVDYRGQVTEHYPENPNGSPHGITGLTTADGRFTIMMPHPERLFRTVQHSWHPAEWGADGPWLRMFRNARKWVG